MFAEHGAHWKHANRYLARPIFIDVPYDAVAVSRVSHSTLPIASSCHSDAGITAQARQTECQFRVFRKLISIVGKGPSGPKVEVHAHSMSWIWAVLSVVSGQIPWVPVGS